MKLHSRRKVPPQHPPQHYQKRHKTPAKSAPSQWTVNILPRRPQRPHGSAPKENQPLKGKPLQPEKWAVEGLPGHAER